MLAVPAVLALMGFTAYALDRIRNEQRLPLTQSSSRSLRQTAPTTDLDAKVAILRMIISDYRLHPI